MGHVLSKEGISPNPEQVEKVKTWPTPKSTKEVHSFIGLASYYHRFIPQFTKWAGPLHELIQPVAMIKKKKKFGIKISPLAQNLPPFEWTIEHQESFERLKHGLITAPILAYPNYEKPFILETDASLKGLGAVLSQQDLHSDQQVIFFVNRSLKPYEKLMRSYSLAKLELLALKWAVCDKFKDYLLGSKFTVSMDNNPLCYVKTSKLGVSQIRWLSLILTSSIEQAGRTRWQTL